MFVATLIRRILKNPVYCGKIAYGRHKTEKTHRTLGHKCDYKKQIHEELLDNTVAKVISKLDNNPKIAALMQQKITMKVDTSAIEQEIADYEKQLRQSYSIKSRLIPLTLMTNTI